MMAMPAEFSSDVVLVGGGHAHAIALRMMAMAPVAGARLTLVSPATHTPYSGMLPGLVAGHYHFDDAHIDLSKLCQWAGVRFITAEVTSLDPDQQVIGFRDRPPISYDVLSIDVGSQPELDSVPGARQWAVPVKPVAGLWQRWLDLSQKLNEMTATSNCRIAVVGGGAGSVELVLAMANRLSAQAVQFDLFCGANDLLPGYSSGARKAVVNALGELDVQLHLGQAVTCVDDGRLQLANGHWHEFEDVFWCTGAAAASWLASSGLPTEAGGFLALRDTLQVYDYDNVFAAGDVATQRNHPRPKAGVFAVRQGPVLAQNLSNFLLKLPLKSHVPQRRFLSLLSLGGQKAVAHKGFFNTSGAAWVWRWKDRIDREFMARFTDYPTSMNTSAPRAISDKTTAQQMPCGGCGAKVSGDSLSRVLRELGEEYPQHCLGAGGADDAAIVPTEDGMLVQSIDVLREMVSDPWIMGRVAANHALSDLYASGAAPHSALATVTVPFATAALQARELKQLLAGALHEFKAVNCRLLGGHSLQGQELNIGFVVNGSPMSPARGLLAKRGLRPGDQLILTKPLGTGTLFASQMQLQANGRVVQGAVETMLMSNAAAGQLAVDHNACAATDVTGFGLLGHLREMLEAGQEAEILSASVPVLSGALHSIRSGIFSSMQDANAAVMRDVEAVNPQVDQTVLELLIDPQTSGGLLIGAAPEDSVSLCDSLQLAGYADAAVIGRVCDSQDQTTSKIIVK